MSEMLSTTYPILLVEDDANDQFLMERTFKKLGKANPLRIVSDGKQAVEYLDGVGKFGNREEHPMPGLILMDLKMPRMNGFEVLEWLREHPHLRKIPVVIMSSSSIYSDVNKAYELGANAYMIKPVGVPALERLIRTLTDFWGVNTAKPF